MASARLVVGGAASFGTTMIEKFKEKSKPHTFFFKEGFGLTESSPGLIFQPSFNQVDGSCGVVAPNTIMKVIDTETRKALGPNCEGELVAAGPQVMKGYYQNER